MSSALTEGLISARAAEPDLGRSSMAKGTCSVKDCDEPARTRGWCGAHYWRWRTNGDVRADVPVRGRPSVPDIAPDRKCSIEGCLKPAKTRGWCKAHYRRWLEYGDPLGMPLRAPCAWPKGCDKMVWVTKSRSGMCEYHAERAWKKANPQVINASNRRYEAKNPQKKAVWGKKWRDANPEKGTEYSAARKARMLGQFVERVYRSVVFKRDRGICGICRKKVDPENWHLDHIVPISRGGEHSYANVQVTHPFCNVSKGTKILEYELHLA